MARYPCPCCGYLTSSSPGGYDICPVCGWEDDLAQLRFANMPWGPNRYSLWDAQQNYLTTGCSDPELVEQGRIRAGSADGVPRDPQWRPLRPDDIEEGEPGVEYGMTYPSDPEQLYYWRATYWRRKGPA